MINTYKKVYWYDEPDTTGDHNDGRIYGVYTYAAGEEAPHDVAWFKTEEEQQHYINKAIS